MKSHREAFIKYEYTLSRLILSVYQEVHCLRIHNDNRIKIPKFVPSKLALNGSVLNNPTNIHLIMLYKRDYQEILCI